jgi:Leucine-rich repeat (LRR) protein
MKKIYFLLLAFSLFINANAQIVDIPDANFKASLLESPYYTKDLAGNYFKIDANNDGQIQELEALEVSSLNLRDLKLYSLVGIQSFKNLKSLNCNDNLLRSLNVTGLTNLEDLDCSFNEIVSLNVTGLTNLKELNCSYNVLTSINVIGLTNLRTLGCNYNQLTSLSGTGLPNLELLDCSNNKLVSLNLTGLTNLRFCFCWRNALTSLDVTGLVNLKTLSCADNSLSSLDLSTLVNLESLYCENNKIADLDIRGSIGMKFLSCGFNQLKSLIISGLINLTGLDCSYNKLRSLDLHNLPSLEVLRCSENNITSLNTNDLKSLRSLDCEGNQLEFLFLKNGRLLSIQVSFRDNPKLKYMCVNESHLSSIQSLVNSYGYTNCQVNTYCSFNPGGSFYKLEGNSKFDLDSNGCGLSDDKISNFNFSITDGINNGNIISNATGNYSIPVQAGTYTITPNLENPTYFNISPTTVNITFPTQTTPFVQDYCITANGVRPDLEVTLIPLVPARPGFDTKYKLVYKNKGNTIQSGAINLTFNDAVLDLVVANPVTTSETLNNLSWNFTNLQPFETREFTFTMNVNSPMETPAVNNGDILNFTTTITSLAADETPLDNTFTLNQTVVGSYDPNDKTCLEGAVITPALIGQYVHYLIRFENTGTFAAENVVIKDMIDLSKFDISTLIPTSASHSYVTKISDGNKVEFIFEKINLPFDDANNDGYIAFKNKTKPTLVVNDSFTNEANIYFDYNFPILTNKATSTFKTLGTQDFDFGKHFTLYPNPTKADLNITAKETINVKSISIYNTLGQLVLVVTNADKVSKIDVSSLTSGNYFLQIKTDKGSSSKRFVKE